MTRCQNTYFNTETTTQSDGVGSGGESNNATGLEPTDMIGAEAPGNMTGFDFSSDWETVTPSTMGSDAHGYPVLKGLSTTPQITVPTPEFKAGQVTDGNPDQIQLQFDMAAGLSAADQTAGFDVNVSGSPVTVTGVQESSSPENITITLAESVSPDESVTVSYDDSTNNLVVREKPQNKAGSFTRSTTDSMFVNRVEADDGGDDDQSDAGGTGGGGAGVPREPASEESGNSALAAVVEQISQTDPATETEVRIQDSDTESGGITVDTSEETQTVDQITFEDESISGSVQVEEYTDPPEAVTESIAETVTADVSETVTDDIQEQGESGTAGTTEDDSSDTDSGSGASVSVNVVTVSDISLASGTDDDASQDTPATVTMSVAREELSSPDNAMIVHETDDGWEQLETTVEDTSQGEVRLSARTESFSLFAVTEVEDTEQSMSTAEPESPSEPTETNEPEPPVPLLIGVAVVALVGAAVWIRTQQQ